MLLDTSGLLAIHHRSEPFHAEAVDHFRVAVRRLTHNYVLAEFVALANTRGIPRQPALEYVRDILSAPHVEAVWVSIAIHNQALDLLFHRLDKTYSLCDAVSFVLMRERGIVDALTTDHHFEQEGFRRLLK